MGEKTQEVQRISMIGLDSERLTIQGFGFGESPGAMKFDRAGDQLVGIGGVHFFGL